MALAVQSVHGVKMGFIHAVLHSGNMSKQKLYLSPSDSTQFFACGSVLCWMMNLD